MKIAVQLYTLRKELAEDFYGVMKEVAALGYDAVEFAGFYNIPAQEMKKLLDELNLTVVGSHTDINQLENNFEEIVAYNRIIGNQNIVIPWARVAQYPDVECLTKRLNAMTYRLNPLGFKLHYHNHSHEFVPYNDGYLLDELFQNVPELMPELDTHWVQRAGVDPVGYLNKYGDRVTLLHLKDLVYEDNNPRFAPLGEGVMNLEEIIKAAFANEVESLIVENDDPRNGGLQDIEISIKYLRKLLMR